MISAIIFLNEKGDSVLIRNYRGDIRRASSEAFRNAIIVKKNTKFPIVQIGRATFFWIREGNLYICACSGKCCNAAVVFEVLHRLIEVFKAYFHGGFSEQIICENAGLIYELLDEVIDYGCPQTLDADVLKSYILQGKPITAQKAKEVTVHATGLSSRPPNISYQKNEMWIDVVEKVNLLVSSKRTVLSADVEGQIGMKCQLSGEPECIFGFNDKLFLNAHARRNQRAQPSGASLELDDMRFHQCVRLGRFNADRTIAFVPPDGEFVLMKFDRVKLEKYRVSERVVKPPFNVVPVIVEYSRTRFIVQVTVSSTFGPNFVADHVLITIPIPTNSARASIETSVGSTKYDGTQHVITWRIRAFPGVSSTQLTANVQLLASVVQTKPWAKPPISMNFCVPMATSSGLEVLFMNVTEPKLHYHTDRYIRYLTKAGNYLIRYPDNTAQDRAQRRN